MQIRNATTDDMEGLYAIDALMRMDASRRRQLEESILQAQCHIALRDGQVVGYGILTYHFFGNGFIELLFVAAEQRRQGIGTALIDSLERTCATAKLFTSTNLSNQRMQLLLAKQGFFLCGMVDQLDDGDPELFFVKRLQKAP